MTADVPISPASGPEALTGYLHREIPLTAAMGLRVSAADAAGVCIEAPFEPNRNLHGTAFAGSLSTTAIVAGWLWVDLALKSLGPAAAVVAQEVHCEFLKPVGGPFVARAEPPLSDDWSRATRLLDRRGKGRVVVRGKIHAGALTCVLFQATFAFSNRL